MFRLDHKEKRKNEGCVSRDNTIYERKIAASERIRELFTPCPLCGKSTKLMVMLLRAQKISNSFGAVQVMRTSQFFKKRQALSLKCLGTFHFPTKDSIYRPED
jgi:hypothetical protein